MVSVCDVFVRFITLGFSASLALRTSPISHGVDDPLILTPYIESGQIEPAQRAAFVEPLVDDIKSYAGFFTVNKTFNSNLFFWYFPAEISPETAPVILWLQGGPGSSSLFGLFEENGAFYIEKNGTLRRRQTYWSQLLNVIYIDNPVGTGFSFTRSEEGYAKDQVQVGTQLLCAINQFFQLFPILKGNDFFVTGESYAGKYVPALAYAIHKNKHELPINLKGLAIGNGLIDPETMNNYADYFYQIGLIDSNQKETFHEIQNEMILSIQHQNYSRATELFEILILQGVTKYDTYFFNATGFSLFYNFLHEKDYSTYGDMNLFIQKDSIKKRIHVGHLTFHTDQTVEIFLLEDITKSVKPWFEELIENYRILIYNGQLDLIVPYPLTLNFLQLLNWSGSDLYKTAERQKWWVDSDLAGYYKSVKGLTEVLVRNAGHMVPTDQPVWAMDLITRFAFGKSF